MSLLLALVGYINTQFINHGRPWLGRGVSHLSRGFLTPVLRLFDTLVVYAYRRPRKNRKYSGANEVESSAFVMCTMRRQSSSLELALHSAESYERYYNNSMFLYRLRVYVLLFSILSRSTLLPSVGFLCRVVNYENISHGPSLVVGGIVRGNYRQRDTFVSLILQLYARREKYFLYGVIGTVRSVLSGWRFLEFSTIIRHLTFQYKTKNCCVILKCAPLVIRSCHFLAISTHIKILQYTLIKFCFCH